MKFFANKSIWKKIVIIFIVIAVFSFVAPKPVAAFGGELLNPIKNFLVIVADGFVWLIQRIVADQDVSFVEIEMSSNWFTRIVGAILVAVGAIGLFALNFWNPAGWAILLAAVLKAAAVALALGGLYVFNLEEGSALENQDMTIAVSFMEADAYGTDKGTLTLPLFSVTPEEIFKGEIPLFDVNFFNPNEERWEGKYAWVNVDSSSSEVSVQFTIYYGYMDYDGEYDFIKKVEFTFNGEDYERSLSYASSAGVRYNSDDDNIINTWMESDNYSIISETINNNLQVPSDLNVMLSNIEKIADEVNISLENTNSEDNAGYTYNKKLTISLYFYDNGSGSYNLDEEASIEAYTSSSTDSTSEVETGVTSITSQISDVVSSWYYGLLILATVGMLSVLVYIGIRILISSSASDKAKYKQRLGDWLVGMVLLFTLHYIMIFANLFVDNIIDFLGSMGEGSNWVAIEDTDDNIKGVLQEIGFELVEIDENVTEDQISDSYDEVASTVYYTEYDGGIYYLWDTNLMGRLRLDLQAYEDERWDAIGYTILYIMMVIYLFMFSVVYIKRVVYMAFLTLIAPLVALTYPIDKMNDGSAQGFNMWFKEYMFNLLLQPMHLLLYTVLVSSALTLAYENPLYAVVALGFMVPAEKILRRMFNFGKAETPGVFGGVAGAAMVMSGMKWLTGHGPHGGKGKGGSDGDKEAADTNGNKFLSTGDRTVKIGGGSPGGGSAGDNSDGGDTGGSSETGSSGGTPGGNPDGTDTSSTDSSGGGDYDVVDAFGNTRAYYDGIDSLFGDDDTQTDTSGQTGDQTQTDDNNSQDRDTSSAQQPLTTRRKFKNAFGNAAGVYGAGLKKKFLRKVSGFKPARTMAGLLGGATLATVGLAAGAASGDFSKAAQYGAVGAAGGYKLASNTAGAVGDTLKVEGVDEAFQRGRLGEEEYQKKMAERNQKIAMQNEEYIKKVQEKLKLSRKEAKERLAEMIPFYYDNKVSNIDDMIEMEKAVKEYNKAGNDSRAREKAFIGWHLNNQYGIDSKIGREKQNEVLQQIQDDYGTDNAQAREYLRFAKFFNNANKNI